MNEDQLLAELRKLRVARVAGQRAVHKPLLVLWLLQNFIEQRARGAQYSKVEASLGELIRKYAPGATEAADVAATPFVHLERSLWHLADKDGRVIRTTPSRSGAWLKKHEARGELTKEFVDLINTPDTLYAAIDALLDEYFSADAAEQVRDELNLKLRPSAPSRPLRPSIPVDVQQLDIHLEEDPPRKQLRLPDDYDSFDRDTRLRWQAFVWLTDLILERGIPLQAKELRGFSFEGKDTLLVDQQGIWKPAGLTAPLSIRTTYTPPNKRPPYEDDEGTDGLIRYKYRGTDPNLFSNVALRQAMKDRRPLIWFKGVAKSIYEPHFPFWVVADEPEKLQIAGSLAPPPVVDPEWKDLVRQT